MFLLTEIIEEMLKAKGYQRVGWIKSTNVTELVGPFTDIYYEILDHNEDPAAFSQHAHACDAICLQDGYLYIYETEISDGKEFKVYDLNDPKCDPEKIIQSFKLMQEIL